MPNVIKVTHEVSDQFLLDVLTNAVESGGLNYWATFQHVMRRDSLDVYEFQVADSEDAHERVTELVEERNIPRSRANEIMSEDSDLWYVVDKAAILHGIQVVLGGHSEQRTFLVDPSIKDMIARAVSEDDADIDAIGCDVIVQAAIFGEIVYG